MYGIAWRTTGYIGAGPVGVPGASDGEGTAEAERIGAAGSPCGRVYPHFVQNKAPGGPSSPQWRQTGTGDGKVYSV